MDYADKASIAETKQRQLSLAALKRRASRHNIGVPVADCLNCGAEIPAARRAAIPNCEYCVNCQTEVETT